MFYSKQINNLRKEKKQQLSQATLTVCSKSSFSRHQMHNKGDRLKETKNIWLLVAQWTEQKLCNLQEVFIK